MVIPSTKVADIGVVSFFAIFTSGFDLKSASKGIKINRLCQPLLVSLTLGIALPELIILPLNTAVNSS